MDYFYSKQIRKLILQTTRMFGGFIVKTGQGRNGTVQDRQVPVRYGETSRMVNHILRLNSENRILYTPFMSVYITSITKASNRRQNPTLVTTHQVDEREFDEETQQYTSNIGDRFTLKRHMPVPYDFIFRLDIWTSNLDQKMQLLEQIMMLFNPSVDLQTSDNPLDWSSITYAEMQDDVTWTSKTVPVGTDEPIDISSMQFWIPYWINPPAEITERKVIELINENIQSVEELPVDDTDFEWGQGDQLVSCQFSPFGNVLKVDGNILTLLNKNAAELSATLDDIENCEEGEILEWGPLLDRFGGITEGESSITIKRKFGDPDGVTGTIEFHPTEKNQLIWTIDPSTLPANTLSDVDMIIDPSKNYPGDGDLPAEMMGQRYLLADNIAGPPTEGWGSASAKVNDIIEFDGLNWTISFDSNGVDADNVQIVTNSFTGKQFRWSPDDQEWQLAVDGLYRPGTWKVIA